MVLTLSAKFGGQDAIPFQVDRKRISIGRSADCDWTLPDPSHQISSRHCEIAWLGDGYAVADTSTNGTFLNGERLQAARRISDGDRIAIGEYIILVTIGGVPSAEGVAATGVTQAPPQPPIASSAAPVGSDPLAAPPSGDISKALSRALAGLAATRQRQRGELGVRESASRSDGPFASQDPWVALAALPPASAHRAIEDVVAAIDRHNAAALMAMQQALRDALAAIGPAAIEAEAALRGGLSDEQRDALLWRAYIARQEGQSRTSPEFLAHFAALFRDAYEKIGTNL
jgi:predicted component of type VI protein secretion system